MQLNSSGGWRWMSLCSESPRGREKHKLRFKSFFERWFIEGCMGMTAARAAWAYQDSSFVYGLAGISAPSWDLSVISGKGRKRCLCQSYDIHELMWYNRGRGCFDPRWGISPGKRSDLCHRTRHQWASIWSLGIVFVTQGQDRLLCSATGQRGAQRGRMTRQGLSYMGGWKNSAWLAWQQRDQEGMLWFLLHSIGRNKC